MENEKKLDLVVTEPTQGNFLKKFVWNKQELMDFAKEKVAKYENLVYSEDNIKDLKKDISDLNKQRKAINDSKISVKKQYMAPYTEFESDVKDVLAIFDNGVQSLKDQYEEYESYRKEEKKKELEKYYNSIAEGTEEILTFDKVFDQRYLNVTVSMKKAKEDIEQKVNIVKEDLETISNLDDDVKFIARTTYERTMNMSHVMSEVTKYRAMKKKEEEEKAKRDLEEQKRIEAEEKEAVDKKENVEEEQDQTNTTVMEEKQETVEAKNEVVDPFEKKEQEVEEKIYCTSFKVWGTMQQIMELKEYMNNKGLRIGKVE